MLTPRGWWLLAVAGTAAVLGAVSVGRYAPAVPILGLTLLAWLALVWIRFEAGWRAAAGRIVVERELLQGGRPVSTAWAGSPCLVRVSLTLTDGFPLPLVVLDDRPPEGYAVESGSQSFVGEMRPGLPLVLEYVLKPTGPGVLRFEGVQLRAADPQALVYRRLFLRDPVEALVLPPLTDDDGHRRADKRFNTLPPPGIHRLRRAGSGSELLDLRDYRPGDPPKMIAWKASARRDRLITKEYESDVPVRCVLFLDGSERVRGGPPGQSPVARLADVASAIAQAAAGNRDLVGLTVFDEHAADVLQPARTPVHTVRLLAKLAETAGRLPAPAVDGVNVMLKRVAPVALDLYPDLFAADLNGRPAGMYWRPLLDTRWGWLVPVIMASPVLVLKREVADLLIGIASALFNQGWVLLGFIILLVLPPVLGLMFWVGYGVQGFFGLHALRTRQRKQLGAIFAAQDGTGPAAVEQAIRDDGYFARRAARFLRDHHIRDGSAGPEPSPRPDAVLADALLRSVLRARDNELYVILADVIDPGPVVDAVRLARSKHHQILVVVPGGPDPDAVAPFELAPSAWQLAERHALLRPAERFETLRTELVRAGAAVVRVADGDPVRAVLDRLDRVRGIRSRR